MTRAPEAMGWRIPEHLTAEMRAGRGEGTDILRSCPDEEDRLARATAVPTVGTRDGKHARDGNVRHEVTERPRTNPSFDRRASRWPNGKDAEERRQGSTYERAGTVDQDGQRTAPRGLVIGVRRHWSES